MDAIRIVIVLALAAIAASLGKALFHLSSGSVNGTRQSALMARALTVRIGLSIALFVLLMMAWHFGGITPHGMS